jgi:hypothetical protein
MIKRSVFFEVRTEYLNIILTSYEQRHFNLVYLKCVQIFNTAYGTHVKET